MTFSPNRVHLLLKCALLAGLVCASQSIAHPGAVANDGCHDQKATDKRHCHPERQRTTTLATCDLKYPPKAGEEGVFDGPLIRVVDGDSFELKVQGVVMDFRLAEIDAPESDQPYGKEARDELKSLVHERTLVLVPIDTDRYGRTVVFAWVGKTCVNEALVRKGAAHFYDEYSTNDFLLHVEEVARDKKKGLWALPPKDRVEPWAFRKEKR
jgi:endonuclease YncB( thermonuclease family)